jgi:hypothetical protein
MLENLFNLKDTFYSNVANSVDVPEAIPIMLRYFDLLPEDENRLEELGEVLWDLLYQRQKEVNGALIVMDLNLETLFRVSVSLTPDKWNKQTVRVTLSRFRQIIDHDGRPTAGSEFRPTLVDAVRLKPILLRYFDLLPEELDWDRELLKKTKWLLDRKMAVREEIFRRLETDKETVKLLHRHLIRSISSQGAERSNRRHVRTQRQESFQPA